MPAGSMRWVPPNCSQGIAWILFTDGGDGSLQPGGEEFGEARLLRLLQDCRTLSAGALQAKILREVAEFGGGPLAGTMPRCWCWPWINQARTEANSSSVPRDLDAEAAAAAGFSIHAHCSRVFSLATHTANPSIATGSMPVVAQRVTDKTVAIVLRVQNHIGDGGKLRFSARLWR